MEVRKMVNDNEEVKVTALNVLKETEDSDPFLILIPMIPSQRARDPVTAKTARRLSTRYHNAAEPASAVCGPPSLLSPRTSFISVHVPYENGIFNVTDATFNRHFP
jgi:hypothetical protein